MNNPLRYGGYAFYQAGYANNDHTSVLEAVRNPELEIPTPPCALIALGLVVSSASACSGSPQARVGAATAPTRPLHRRREEEISPSSPLRSACFG